VRTLVFIVIGLVVAFLAVWLAKPAWRRPAAGGFTVAWLVAVLWNLRTGMSHGYSLQEEAPIQAVIFALPVLVAWWMAWRTRRR
jgi:hypothetical protein